MNNLNAQQLCTIAINALENIKAKQITCLDTRQLTELFDYMIIASADSHRQVKALAREVTAQIQKANGEIVGIEGEIYSEWILVDAGLVVIHIMLPSVRDYYQLEQLWQSSNEVVAEPATYHSPSPLAHTAIYY